MDGWNTTFLLGRLIFRGYVSFREGKFEDSYSTTSGTFSPSFLAPLPAASSEVSFNLDCGTARRWTKSNGPQIYWNSWQPLGPLLKVKLLVGPTFVKSHDQLRGANPTINSKGRSSGISGDHRIDVPRNAWFLDVPGRKWTDQWWSDQWVISPILINGLFLGVK